MSVIYTIGYKGKSLETFITQLRNAHIDAIIDIRLLNTSHLAGYTKRDTFSFLLREGFGIAYEHHLELAPTPQIRNAYRENADWTAYESNFVPLLRERAAEKVGQEILKRYHAPCLLCAETSAQHCHRRLVAEYWTIHLPELTIIHL